MAHGNEKSQTSTFLVLSFFNKTRGEPKNHKPQEENKKRGEEGQQATQPSKNQSRANQAQRGPKRPQAGRGP